MNKTNTIFSLTQWLPLYKRPNLERAIPRSQQRHCYFRWVSLRWLYYNTGSDPSSHQFLPIYRLYEWFQDWADEKVHHRGTEYEALKEKLTHHLLEIFYENFPHVKGKIEFSFTATPLTEETFLQCFRGGGYDTLCTPDMFAPVNQKWVTTPRTSIPGLYVAGSSAFFPGLTGAMYGGCLCACNVLGLLGTVRLGHSVIHNLATRLQEEDPKLGWFQAYFKAIDKFVNK